MQGLIQNWLFQLNVHYFHDCVVVQILYRTLQTDLQIFEFRTDRANKKEKQLRRLFNDVMFQHFHFVFFPSCFQIPERLMLTLELLKKELAVATLQQKLGKEVHTVLVLSGMCLVCGIRSLSFIWL